MDLNALKYPVGTFKLPLSSTPTQITTWIEAIRSFPGAMSEAVKDLTQDQLEWKYRPDGWCIRQVVHHCADSHSYGMGKFKLPLTEDCPTIKPYMQDQWVLLPDMQTPIEWSLTLLDGLHKRWVVLLENLSEEDLEKTYIHPEYERTYTVRQTIAQYAWHCNHHLAHIRQAIKSEGSY